MAHGPAATARTRAALLCTLLALSGLGVAGRTDPPLAAGEPLFSGALIDLAADPVAHARPVTPAEFAADLAALRASAAAGDPTAQGALGAALLFGRRNRGRTTKLAVPASTKPGIRALGMAL